MRASSKPQMNLGWILACSYFVAGQGAVGWMDDGSGFRETVQILDSETREYENCVKELGEILSQHIEGTNPKYGMSVEIKSINELLERKGLVEKDDLSLTICTNHGWQNSIADACNRLHNAILQDDPEETLKYLSKIKKAEKLLADAENCIKILSHTIIYNQENSDFKSRFKSLLEALAKARKPLEKIASIKIERDGHQTAPQTLEMPFQSSWLVLAKLDEILAKMDIYFAAVPQ